MYDIEKLILPDFPRIMHLPLEPNASSDDKIASMEQLKWLLDQDCVIEEKIDVANSGITLFNDQPLIRNRTKILNKSYQAKGKAKEQFSPIWTWFYNNQQKLKALSKMLGYMPSVYGEWMYAKHTIYYDKLPDWFVAYDIYNPNTQSFEPTLKARSYLLDAGFSLVPWIANGKVDAENLLSFRNGLSEFSTTENKEGVYIKVSDEDKMIARFKMVRPDFKSDDNWAKTALIKNQIS